MKQKKPWWWLYAFFVNALACLLLYACAAVLLRRLLREMPPHCRVALVGVVSCTFFGTLLLSHAILLVILRVIEGKRLGRAPGGSCQGTEVPGALREHK